MTQSFNAGGQDRSGRDHQRRMALVVAGILAAVGFGLVGVAAASQHAAPPQVPLAATPDDRQAAVATTAPAHTPSPTPATDGASTPAAPSVTTASPTPPAPPDAADASDAPTGEPQEPSAAQPVADKPAAPPVRVRVPSIDVDSDLVGLGLDADRALEVPDDPALAGWFDLGTRPGDHGAAVIAGHVDTYRGPAIFYRLATLQPGAEVLVDREDGTTAVFRVDEIERYPKDDLPTTRVYAASARELRLITCGGAFDDDVRSYLDNVVAYATFTETR